MKMNILAIEKYLPQNRVSSESMDQLFKGPKGGIEKKTGVQFRHQVAENETVSEMGAKVLQKALDKAQLKASEIDLLIFAGASYDYPVPHNSVIIKSKITDDKTSFGCLDIDTTCLSFLNALDVAHVYLQAGRYQKIALVCAEIASRALSTQDEKTFGLFGDAAVAMIIEPSAEKGYSCRYVDFENYPSGAMLAHVPIGGAVNRGIHASPTDLGYYFNMDGLNIIRLTIKYLDIFVDKMEKNIQYKLTDFDHIVTHQTSKYGNEYFLRNFKLKREKVVETLPKYGNCISASIPLGLESLVNEQADLTQKKVLLLGSGAGLSLGAMVLEFG